MEKVFGITFFSSYIFNELLLLFLFFLPFAGVRSFRRVKRLNNLEQTKKISNNKPLYAITKRYVGMREKEVPWEKKKGFVCCAPTHDAISLLDASSSSQYQSTILYSQLQQVVYSICILVVVVAAGR